MCVCERASESVRWCEIEEKKMVSERKLGLGGGGGGGETELKGGTFEWL